MPEPTGRELAVQHYAEEVRRKELLDDAIRVVLNNTWVISPEQRRQLDEITNTLRRASEKGLAIAFERAVEAENK